MASPGVGGSLSAASDVLLDSPVDDQVLKREGSYWKNLADQNGGGGTSVAPLLVAATANITVTQADVVVTGQGANNQQVVEVQHVTANGQTTQTLATVTLPANSVASVDPSTFSQAFVRGDRIQLVRTSGTGAAPILSISVL